MKFCAGRMYPKSGAISRRGNVAGAIDNHRLSCLLAGQQFSDVEVSVALRSAFLAVVGDGPIATPKFLCSCDGGGPEQVAEAGVQCMQAVRPRVMGSREDKQAVRFCRISVL